MGNVIVVALRATIVTLILTGVAYPLAMTGLSQALFHSKANGSLVEVGGKVVGSEQLGQISANPGYFQPRPSAAGQNGYDPTASSGSNLGPTSQKLKDRVTADIERLQKENPNAPGPVPDELVTTSGSGLDPHLSPEAARWQIPRIAAFRKVAPDRIRAIVEGAIEERQLGVLGEPHVTCCSSTSRSTNSSVSHLRLRPLPPGHRPRQRRRVRHPSQATRRLRVPSATLTASVAWRILTTGHDRRPNPRRGLSRAGRAGKAWKAQALPRICRRCR
jgi:K+-transporting ATPase ATPase C chain